MRLPPQLGTSIPSWLRRDCAMQSPRAHDYATTSLQPTLYSIRRLLQLLEAFMTSSTQEGDGKRPRSNS
jgi:hypothetical protein